MSRLRDSGIAVRALCVLAVLSGCVSVPLPESPGSAWRPPDGGQARDPVWAGIRARQPDLAGPLALPDLMRIALESNPAGRKAWNEARAAAAQARQAQGVGTQLDVLQARAGHDRALYGLAAAEGARHAAQGALAQALGLPADAAVQVAQPTWQAPPPRTTSPSTATARDSPACSTC